MFDAICALIFLSSDFFFFFFPFFFSSRAEVPAEPACASVFSVDAPCCRVWAGSGPYGPSVVASTGSSCREGEGGSGWSCTQALGARAASQALRVRPERGVSAGCCCLAASVPDGVGSSASCPLELG